MAFVYLVLLRRQKLFDKMNQDGERSRAGSHKRNVDIITPLLSGDILPRRRGVSAQSAESATRLAVAMMTTSGKYHPLLLALIL